MSPNHLLDPFRSAGTSIDRRATDHLVGRKVFWRLSDEERLLLVSVLVQALSQGTALNPAAVGGALREAWTSEPYLDGPRLGSYVSAVAAMTKKISPRRMRDLATVWGDEMMTSKERDRLKALSFPIKVYRGGIEPARELGLGFNWTTDIEVARRFATIWPQRWSLEGSATMVAMKIERSEVAALFDDREEGEILVPRGTAGGRHVAVITLDHNDATDPSGASQD